MTPEKIYIHTTHHGELLDTWGTEKADQWPEYISKDIHDKAIAAERERCAKIAEDRVDTLRGLSYVTGDTAFFRWREAMKIAKAIREGE